jgi:hypothetical protein
MAMQIKFNDDYKEVSTYNGVINEVYKFTVDVYYDSIDKKYFVKGVEFTDDMGVNFDKQKAIKRIKSIVKEWYYLDE